MIVDSRAADLASAGEVEALRDDAITPLGFRCRG